MPKYSGAPERPRTRRHIVVSAVALAAVLIGGAAWASTPFPGKTASSTSDPAVSDGAPATATGALNGDHAAKAHRENVQRKGPRWSQHRLDRPTPKPTPSPTTKASPTEEPSPTETPSESTTPSPTATNDPVETKFPNADTTGVPEGTNLKPSRSLTVTEDGAVLDALEIAGTVKVEADNVTIRNSRIISSGRYAIEVGSNAKNLVVEDSEIDGNGTATIAILRGEYTLRRVNIHDVQDGPRIEGDNVLIEDSYIHDLHRIDGGHHDTLQIRQASSVIIRGNNFQAYKADTSDPMNAAIQFGSALGPIEDVLIEGNLLNGGNYTINASKLTGDPVTIRDNRFGTDYRYGVLSSGPGLAWAKSNIYHESGEPAP